MVQGQQAFREFCFRQRHRPAMRHRQSRVQLPMRNRQRIWGGRCAALVSTEHVERSPRKSACTSAQAASKSSGRVMSLKVRSCSSCLEYQTVSGQRRFTFNNLLLYQYAQYLQPLARRSPQIAPRYRQASATVYRSFRERTFISGNSPGCLSRPAEDRLASCCPSLACQDITLVCRTIGCFARVQKLDFHTPCFRWRTKSGQNDLQFSGQY